jgi:predicted AAA+ superfamily ATPase
MEKSALEKRLLYGWYPEVLTSPGEEEENLGQLLNSYLYKDILQWERILKPDKLERLLQALAFQIGKEVSLTELGQIVDLDKATVDRYIQLLEKAFIIFRIGSFSRNLRNELKNSRKVFFYDVGIRNAIINQFSPIPLRQDIGQLWENFWIAERVKYTVNAGLRVNRYFWRTHTLQEIDYIEERNGTLTAFECKWGTRKLPAVPKLFAETYANHTWHAVTPENFENYLM